ncbi:MAG: DUF484 family protein [Burkholderiaceae bacterium]|jgi:uncharacterized protein YigA (DUF484 family)
MSANSLPPITEDDIAEYLTNTPDFFERHNEVLATVQLTSPHSHRAISLQERQAEILRGKVRDLELKAAQMIRYGQSNVTIADKLQDWTCDLLTARDADALVEVATARLATIYDIPQVAIRLWGVAPTYADRPYAAGVENAIKTYADELTEAYCGVRRELPLLNWLTDGDSVTSMAVVPLRQSAEAPVFGLLVLASGDENRFTADMGTLFLDRISAQASAALSRLLP